MTGRQIREARSVLGWDPWRVAKAARVTTSELILAEAADDRCPASASQALAIQRALEAAGIEFVEGSSGQVALRLRKDDR